MWSHSRCHVEHAIACALRQSCSYCISHVVCIPLKPGAPSMHAEASISLSLLSLPVSGRIYVGVILLSGVCEAIKLYSPHQAVVSILVAPYLAY